jgi:PPE-repeat protein
MMDFAVLPPEVNSGRMYAGAGSSSMMTAASAWDQLAATLGTAASSYQNVVTELTDGPWLGAASAMMAAAAHPYVGWMHTTAAQAAQTANQARSAAAAYEAALAATVPPTLVAANRSQLASLAATNTFGQNSAAIAANQAQYGEMWAQDATAMQTYSAHSAAATTTLTKFTAPPQTTNPAAAGTQSGASAPSDPGPLTTLAMLIVDNPTVSGVGTFLGDTQNIFFQTVLAGFIQAFQQYFLIVPDIAGASTAAVSYAGSLGLASSVSPGAEQFTLVGSSSSGLGAAGASGVGGGQVAAGMGRAAPVGGLSVPPSWHGGTRLAASVRPLFAGGSAWPAGGMGPGGGWFGGIPPVASVVNAPSNGERRPRLDSGAKVIPQLGKAVPAGAGVRNRSARPAAAAPRGAPSNSKRNELNRLRQVAAELAQEREVLERSAGALLKSAGLSPAPPRK